MHEYYLICDSHVVMMHRNSKHRCTWFQLRILTWDLVEPKLTLYWRSIVHTEESYMWQLIQIL